MTGISDLERLLSELSPRLLEGDWVFCSIDGSEARLTAALMPLALATFREDEGLSLLLPVSVAKEHALGYEGLFRGITLDVHSSLAAVGLTAAVARSLADAGISANVIAATNHDHVFVPSAESGRALELLRRLSRV